MFSILEFLLIGIALYVGFGILPRYAQKREIRRIETAACEEMAYPFLIKTPVRERLWNSFKYIFKSENGTLFDVVYAFYATGLMRFFSEPVYSIFQTNDPYLKQHTESDNILLYFIPYYNYALLEHSSSHLYFSDRYKQILLSCTDKFLKDYCLVSNTSYAEVSSLVYSKLNNYNDTSEFHLRISLVDDIMSNYFNYSDANGFRVKLLAYVSTFILCTLPQTQLSMQSFVEKYANRSSQ